jgi:hypothetical protein
MDNVQKSPKHRRVSIKDGTTDNKTQYCDSYYILRFVLMQTDKQKKTLFVACREARPMVVSQHSTEQQDCPENQEIRTHGERTASASGVLAA